MKELGGIVIGLIILIPVVILSFKEVKRKLKGGCSCNGDCPFKNGRE